MTATIDPDYATVGGLLLAPDHYEAVAEWLRPEDFARPLCGEVFQLVGQMRARDFPVDPVTVLGELRHLGRVRSDGYPAMELIAMVQAVPVPASTPYYARLVLAESVFRRISDCGTRLSQVGRRARGTPDDAFDTLARSWEGLGEVHSRWEHASGRGHVYASDHDRTAARRSLEPPARLAARVGGLDR
jgi:replicative DNA helicase